MKIIHVFEIHNQDYLVRQVLFFLLIVRSVLRSISLLHCYVLFLVVAFLAVLLVHSHELE